MAGTENNSVLPLVLFIILVTYWFLKHFLRNKRIRFFPLFERSNKELIVRTTIFFHPLLDVLNPKMSINSILKDQCGATAILIFNLLFT